MYCDSSPLWGHQEAKCYVTTFDCFRSTLRWYCWLTHAIPLHIGDPKMAGVMEPFQWGLVGNICMLGTCGIPNELH